MLRTKVKIGIAEYFIPATEHAADLMDAIVAQVRAGGGFVELVRSPARSVSVLVSPGMTLAVETTQVEDEDSAAPESAILWHESFDGLETW